MSEIIGLLIVIATLLVMEPRLLHWTVSANRTVSQTALAQQAAIFNTAAQKYITENSGLLYATATATTPIIVTAATLQADGFLPTTFSPVDLYGQTWELQVLQPTAGTLTSVTLTTGGTPLKDGQAAEAAQMIGAAGGFVPLNDSGAYPQTSPLSAYGTQGAWKLLLAHFSGVTQGELATYLSLEDSTGQLSDYLYRNQVPGNPSLNTMTTPLIMASVQTAGNACTTTGAIAQDGTGALLSCQSGAWTQVGGGHWKPPVASYSSLPASGNQNGDVRLTTDYDRAYAWNGTTSSWVALGIDQNGNLTVPNSLTAGGGQVQLGSAGFGSFLTMNSNTGENLSLVSQNNYMTLWDGSRGASVWKAESNGEWDSDEGGFCFSGAGNTSNDCNSTWGFQPRYGTGWSMVTSVNGSLNAQAQAAPGSIHANDYYDRATGWWFSQAVNQIQANQSNISSLQSTVAAQGGQINNINNNLNSGSPCAGSAPYAYTALNSICQRAQAAGLNVSFLRSFGPIYSTSSTSTGYWHYRYRYGFFCAPGYTGYGTCTISGAPSPASYSISVPGGSPPELVAVSAIMGKTNNPYGANWGNLGGFGGCSSGTDVIVTVDGVQVADIALSQVPQPNYIQPVTAENSATFVVPTGGSATIQAGQTCVGITGTIWNL
ncbi:MAG: shufflon system plasmid conjugative transfer pilus tip adhesin PilV [Terriglobia bacterium]|nr:shufflon system plasmid conjugative transfer pilus tip adhesin PilV [Terriglobia bacterium]